MACALSLLPSCASSPVFDLEPATASMPSEWVESVESVPYMPSTEENSVQARAAKESPSTGQTPSPAPSTPAVLSPPRDLPYGVPVPGKKGLVRSPWSDQGFVDTSGMPPGVEAKCPYSGKVFLVP